MVDGGAFLAECHKQQIRQEQYAHSSFFYKRIIPVKRLHTSKMNII